ncbi:MAG: peroxiredoxin family protein [Pirellulales bacterium]
MVPAEAVVPAVPSVRDQYAASSLISVGDSLPKLGAQTLDGEEVEIDALRRDATALVLLFWDSRTDLSVLELEWIQQDIAEPRADQGVVVVAVNRGDDADTVGRIIAQHGVQFAVLLDPEAEAFEKVAEKFVPRTYVVDDAGVIRGMWIGFQGRSTIDAVAATLEEVLAP